MGVELSIEEEDLLLLKAIRLAFDRGYMVCDQDYHYEYYRIANSIPSLIDWYERYS